MAALAVCTLGLPLAALAAPQTKTPFTHTHVQTITDWGRWLFDGTKLYAMGVTADFVWTASDPRVAGKGIITAAAIWDTNLLGFTWASFQVTNANGTWTGYARGTQSLKDGQYLGSYEMTAAGGGGYQGLVLRMTGTAGNIYAPIESSGYIVAGGPGDLPFVAHGFLAEQLQIIPGVFVEPPTFMPTGMGVVARADLVGAVEEVSHTGRLSAQGVGLVDPVTGVSTTMGTDIVANGDELHWVDSSTLGPAGAVMGEVHLAGGTGRFADATGAFSYEMTVTIEPTEDPLVSIVSGSYRATGKMRYSAPATIRK